MEDMERTNDRNAENENNGVQNTDNIKTEENASPVDNRAEQTTAKRDENPTQNTRDTGSAGGQYSSPTGYYYGPTGGAYYQAQNQNQNQNPQYQYYNPNMANGQIAYTPYPPQKQQKKPRKPMSRGAIALLCCGVIILSGCFGFGGAYFAGYLLDRYDVDGDVNEVVNNNVDDFLSENQGGVVIYKGGEVPEVDVGKGSAGDSTLSYSEVAAIVKDSVVEITTEYNVPNSWFQYVTQGAGSGVIISTDGYIITNSHVILDSETLAVADAITVRLTDGSEYKASVVRYDVDMDVAIIKIDAKDLTAAQCGDSDLLVVGEELVIVGNPLGELGGSVSNGIVSATKREIQVSGVTMSLIQTNAAVNPGNSGGGMFNMKGQLVGIVNAKSSGTGIEGLGFAIPINEVLSITEQLLEYGYVRGRSMIGVNFTDVQNSSMLYYYNMKPGVYVSGLTEGYNDQVLQVGDRVVAVNDSEISGFADIKAIVSASSIGDVLKFQIYRNGKLMEVDVTCYEKVPSDVEPSIEFKEEIESALVNSDGEKSGAKDFEVRTGSKGITDFDVNNK